MSEGNYGINMIVYGHPKHGKSYLGDTTPAPRLVLDAEGGSRFTPSRKRAWDPVREAPPQPDGTWDTAIVYVHTFKDISKAFEWLNSGKHPFKSVIIDSISEVQQRAVDDIAGINQMKQQDWGTLLRVVSDMIRKFRDLVTHATHPLDAVIFIAMAAQRQPEGTWYPFMQGRLATTLPYYVDIVGYLAQSVTDEGVQFRRLYIGTMPGYETGERVGGKLGTYVDIPDGDGHVVERMIEQVREQQKELSE